MRPTRDTNAESLLEGGDWGGARDAALQALEGFGHLRKQESEWRGRLIVARANQLAGDRAAARHEYARAASVLSAIQKLWGDKAFEAYSSRPPSSVRMQTWLETSPRSKPMKSIADFPFIAVFCRRMFGAVCYRR